MLTEQDVRKLLAAASSFDNRRPADAPVTAWSAAANEGRWTYDEAVAAIVKHYAHSTEFLMPGHITALVKAGRTERAMKAPLQIGAADALAAEAVHARVEQIGRELGWERAEPSSDLRRAMTKRCPHCGVLAGARCVTPMGRPLGKDPGFHPARGEATQ